MAFGTVNKPALLVPLLPNHHGLPSTSPEKEGVQQPPQRSMWWARAMQPLAEQRPPYLVLIQGYRGWDFGKAEGGSTGTTGDDGLRRRRTLRRSTGR